MYQQHQQHFRTHHRNRKLPFFSDRSGHRRAARKKFEGLRPHWRSEYPGRYHADDSERDCHDGRGIWLGVGECIALCVAVDVLAAYFYRLYDEYLNVHILREV